jgi:hypothetical protein
MDEQPIEDFVVQHRAKLKEEFRSPAFEVFDQRAPNPLPPAVRDYFELGERLFGSSFMIDCGKSLPLCIQYFVPLNLASIDACERRNWRFLAVACGDEGEALLVSLDQQLTVFVEWTEHEPPEDTGIAFVDFVAGVRRAVGA